jgi:type I restriction enzyme S subunit
MPIVSKSRFEKLEIPVPPISVQQNIANILDCTEALRIKRREAIALLDNLAQSIFLDMFGDPARNPMHWPVNKIGDLVESARYGTSEKARTQGSLPVLRMNNITSSGDMDLRDLKYMDQSTVDDRYLIHRGDILFNRTNSPELVGKTALYRDTRPMAYAGYLVRVRANSRNDSEYLAAFLNTRHAKKILRNMCKSIVGMANINARELQSIEIAEPPLTLQREFATRISAVESFKATQRAHLAELDALFASLQHRAFRGELGDAPAA